MSRFAIYKGAKDGEGLKVSQTGPGNISMVRELLPPAPPAIAEHFPLMVILKKAAVHHKRCATAAFLQVNNCLLILIYAYNRLRNDSGRPRQAEEFPNGRFYPDIHSSGLQSGTHSED